MDSGALFVKNGEIYSDQANVEITKRLNGILGTVKVPLDSFGDHNLFELSTGTKYALP